MPCENLVCLTLKFLILCWFLLFRIVRLRLLDRCSMLKDLLASKNCRVSLEVLPALVSTPRP